MLETQVQSLGREDPLEKEMATHSTVLAWKIPWTEEPGGLQSVGSQSQTRLSDFTFTLLIHVSEEWSLVRGRLSSYITLMVNISGTPWGPAPQASQEWRAHLDAGCLGCESSCFRAYDFS